MGSYDKIEWASFSNCYPVLDRRIELHRSATGGHLIYSIRDEDKLATDTASLAGYQILDAEGYMVDFLSLCDGQSTMEDISREMSQRVNPLFGPTLALQALESATKSGLIDISPEPVARDDVRVTGSARSFQPLHLTLEIIETCNFSCDHCYYSSSPFKKGILPVEDAIRIMDRAHENGVRAIELTGGECTIHPGFREIFAHASRTFGLVAVITNGYRIGNDEELAEFVGRRPNVVVQISVDGLAAHHDVFRKHRKSFEACERAVKRLSAMGCKVRIATTITEGNTKDIAPLFECAKEWGATQIVFAPVASIGRGCNVSESGAAGATHLVHAIQRELAPFSGDPLLGAPSPVPTSAKYEEATNCGAGWRTFAVDYDGEVRACNYSRDSKKFGNILNSEYEHVFSQKANYLFNNAAAPGGEECRDCRYYFNCKGCFVKAFMVSETEFPECPWRAKWFPDMELGPEKEISPVASISEVSANLPRGAKGQIPACAGCGTVGESCH